MKCAMIITAFFLIATRSFSQESIKNFLDSCNKLYESKYDVKRHLIAKTKIDTTKNILISPFLSRDIISISYLNFRSKKPIGTLDNQNLYDYFDLIVYEYDYSQSAQKKLDEIFEKSNGPNEFYGPLGKDYNGVICTDKYIIRFRKGCRVDIKKWESFRAEILNLVVRFFKTINGKQIEILCGGKLI